MTRQRYVRIDGELFLVVTPREIQRPRTRHEASMLARTLLESRSLANEWAVNRALCGTWSLPARNPLEQLVDRLRMGSICVVVPEPQQRLLDPVQVRPLVEEPDVPDAPRLGGKTRAERDDDPAVPASEPPGPVVPPRVDAPSPRPAGPKPQLTFIDITCIGSRGSSFAGAPLLVRMPDGSQRRETLDDASSWRADDIPGDGVCKLELPDDAYPNRDVPREAPVPANEASGTLSPGSGELGLRTASSHIVVVREPAAACVRLSGMLFALNKAFLLPGALEGIRLLRHMYDKMPGASLLVVGHTDTTGSTRRNKSLSLQRAEAVVAYLADDVDAWLQYYGRGTDFSRRWGQSEDLEMLSALPFGEPAFYGDHHEDHSVEAALLRFQSAHGLAETGKPDAETRRALIGAYMAADRTTLPPDAQAVAHGCGQHFLAVETDDDVPEPANRRVEVFFFRDGVDPPPPGSISEPGSPEYPAWLEAVEEERTFTPAAAGLGSLLLVTDIEAEHAEESGVTFTLRSTDETYEQIRLPHRDGTPRRGYIEIQFTDMPRASFYTLVVRYASGHEAPLFEDIPFPELHRLSSPPKEPIINPFTGQLEE